MRIIKRLLGFICFLFLLINILVVLCYFYPGLGETFDDFLYQTKVLEFDKKINNSIHKSINNLANLVKEIQSDDNQDNISSILEDSYEKLKKEKQHIANELIERTGYIPVQDNTEQIAEDEADTIFKQVGKGETGKNLSFDEDIYPYYGMLNDNERILYRQIYANAKASNEVFVPVVELTVDELKKTFTAVCNDQPELFWLDTSYLCKTTQSGIMVEITLQFNLKDNNLKTAKNNFVNSTNEILAGAENLESDYEKEVYVHDTLISQVEYNLKAPLSQSAYSALVNGQTVCAGYARAFQYLMQQLGVPCYYCTGYSGEDHAWNIISLDDGYYNVDATWDDTNPNTYNYFNCPDSEFAKDHVRTDLSVNLPACKGGKYEDLVKNKD